MKVEFFGAAGEVTGSCHIVHCAGRRVLLDCGLVQGSRRQEARNSEPFPFDPATIDAVVLSHAHIDHSGRLPLLVKQGYTGPIYAHPATVDFCYIMLRDSAYLNERDAELETRKRQRKGLSAVAPLYRMDDALRAYRQLVAVPYGVRREIAPGIALRFKDAGHIMGSAIVELWGREGGGAERKLVFSGDLGQYDSPILRDPEPIERADLLLMECTYGDRLHRPREETVAEIAEILAAADHQRGNVLIPAFAVGRSQELLYMFGKHYEEWKLDRWRIFLDSPMAIDASAIYWKHPHLYDEEALTLRQAAEKMRFLPNLELTRFAEDSMRINQMRRGAVIIAGSGMCTGGRILHHFKHNLWRDACHVVIVGYQAEGTLGRRLVDGAQYVSIHHEAIRVRAQVHTVGGLSAHADQDDLIRWVRHLQPAPPVYLVHGERRAAEGLTARLGREGFKSVHWPTPGTSVVV